MLEEKDIQAIGEIFDQRIKTSLDERIGEILDQKIKTHLDEKIGEVLVAVNEGFNGMQEQINGIHEQIGDIHEQIGDIHEQMGGMKEQINDLHEEMLKRPTRDEVFSWADRRIVDLEIAKDRHNFLHIKELKNLPSASEISRALVEQGVKDGLN